MMDRYLITPDTPLNLADHDPDDTSLCPEGADAGASQLEAERTELANHKAT